ncbi:hypothetical protein [Sorangium sp. So ce1099]
MSTSSSARRSNGDPAGRGVEALEAAIEAQGIDASGFMDGAIEGANGATA